MTSLQVPLVQRTFRRGLNHWLEALLWPAPPGDPEVRRLAEALARSASTCALVELERVARSVVHGEDRDVPAHVDALLDLVRREMHPVDAAAMRSRRTVIVVARAPSLLAQLNEAASRYAHRVEVFDALDAARAHVARTWPGLVLVDVGLDDDPLGWLCELREAPDGAELPILAIADGPRPDVLALGASEVFTTPLDRLRLDDALGAWLGREGRTIVERSGDPVTGLPGPGLFQEAVTDQGARHGGRRWCLGLLVWRNRAELGRLDEVATAAAARALGTALAQRFPTATLFARLDLDSFGLLLPDVDASNALPWLEDVVEGLRWVHPLQLELGMGAVVALQADYAQALATARRMHTLAAVAGQRVLLTTIDELPMQRVLFVHDSPELASVVRGALRGSLLEVVHRKSAIEGLEAAASLPFDLVVVGASLPSQGAFDLLGTLRSWPSFADRPVILLTTDDRERVRAYDLGADECVAAPFTTEVLRARIRSRLGSK